MPPPAHRKTNTILAEPNSSHGSWALPAPILPWERPVHFGLLEEIDMQSPPSQG